MLLPGKFQEGFRKVPERFKQGSMHFCVTIPTPQRLKPDRFAVWNLTQSLVGSNNGQNAALVYVFVTSCIYIYIVVLR